MTSPKDTLRQEAIKHRSRMDLSIEDPEDCIDIFWGAINPAPDQIIALYCAKGRELDPYPLLEDLSAKGFHTCLPVVRPKTKILQFQSWKPDEPLTKGTFGILEPQEGAMVDPDIVIVPLLAFDRKGNRLGYGGGYYDATLADLRAKKPVIAAGYAYSAQAVLFPLPAEDHDEALDFVITPGKMFSF